MATMETGVEVPQTLKLVLPYNLIYNLGVYLKEAKSADYREICISILIAALLI